LVALPARSKDLEADWVKLKMRNYNKVTQKAARVVTAAR